MLMLRPMIPITDLLATPVFSDSSAAPAEQLTDFLGRELRDLRISVTDQCNFRCVYCMPRAVFGKDHTFLQQGALLSFEEIERLARIFVQQGVKKIRLTGGEPLLRKNIEHLIERLASLRTPEGRQLDVTLTTNGSLLARKARSLKDAGLSRVTVSLDALDDDLFGRMNDAGFPVAEALKGIEAAHSVGLAPVKVNMVVKRGMNDQEILPMARYFKGSNAILRFIEYMDVGASNHWKMSEVLPSEEVIALISTQFPLRRLDAQNENDTAQRWGYEDGSGEIGVISSVTRAFCGTCTRARLSAEGKLYLCLFAGGGHDLRSLIRGGASDINIASAIARVWKGRMDRYSELRGQIAVPELSPDTQKVEMSYIGG